MRDGNICDKTLLPETFYCPCHCFNTTRTVHYSHTFLFFPNSCQVLKVFIFLHILCAMRMLSSILLFMHLVIYSNYILHKCGYYNFLHREVWNRRNGKKGNKPYASCAMSALQLSHIILTFIPFTSSSLQICRPHTTKITNISGGHNHISI